MWNECCFYFWQTELTESKFLAFSKYQKLNSSYTKYSSYRGKDSDNSSSYKVTVFLCDFSLTLNTMVDFHSPPSYI